MTKSKLSFSQATKRSKYQTFEPPEIKSNPLLAINEMCNYITACSCHLENWYFVTHFDSFLLPLTLFIPLSFQDVYKNQIQSENYSEEKWIIITHSCIACQFAFLLPCELWQIFSRTDLLYNHSIINGVVVWIFNPQTIM